MRIAVEYTVGPNIGDGIYQLSLAGIMKAAFPSASVSLADGPMDRSFAARPKFADRWLGARRFALPERQVTDLLVLSGPILSDTFVRSYGRTIQRQVESGGAYALVSVHAPRYDDGVVTFLNAFPPALIATRDSPSLDHLAGVRSDTYDGVCAALLVRHTIEITEADGRYLTASFYAGFEPTIAFETRDPNEIDFATLTIGGYNPDRRWRHQRHRDFLRSAPQRISGFEVVRPVHDIGYKYAHLNLARPNSFLSYNPASYLSIYSGTSLTVSDRVHAVVPTLGLGRPAVFVGDTPRAKIFDRVGLNPSAGVMRLGGDVIDAEYEALIETIRQHCSM